MDDHHRAFIAEIRRNPDDDTPRLIYADWLEEQGEPRAELIRIQCEIENLKKWDERYFQLKQRENALLLEHKDRWLTQQSKLNGAEWRNFSRGLNEHLYIDDLSEFATNKADALEGACILEVTIREPTLHQLETMIRSPYLAQIKKLHIHKTKVRPEQTIDALFNETSQFATLETLSLWENDLGVEGTTALAGVPLGHLKTLNLHWNRIGESGAEVLAASSNLPQLKTLDLSYNGIGSRGVKELMASPHYPHLESLQLESNQLESSGATAIADSLLIGRLKSLDIRNNQIDPQGIASLASSPNISKLQILNVGSNQIGDPGAEAIAESPYVSQLRSLNVNSNQITMRGVEAITQSPHLSNLQVLDIAINRLGDCVSQRETVLQASKLVDIDLSYCNLNINSLRSLFNTIDLSRLCALDLGNNSELSAEGAAFVALVPELTNLRSLELYQNKIPDEGVVAIAKSPYLSVLTNLDLAKNWIGNPGAEALAASENLKHLVALNLNQNRIRTAGVEAIAESVHLSNLVKLQLQDNAFGYPAELILRDRFGDGVEL